MMYGVEVHATIANNLLTQSWITRPSQLIEIAGQAILLGAISFLGISVTPIVLLIVSAALMLLWTIIAIWGLYAGFYLCGASSVLLGTPAILLISTVLSYLTSRKSEQSLKSAFSLYLSPEMLPELQRDGSSLKLGGEKLWLTALFTDIADFTSITEEMPAERTSEMLNAYFTEVMEVVFQNQGTLIKFIGDAVFAIWGAPVKIANHAELSVRTALAIQQEVNKFNATKRFPPLITRVGINTGPMLVGNLGSKRRFDYTAIGDSVNLAARLEGLNKYFGTLILFSEATRRDAGGIEGSVSIGKVRVKGKKEAVSLYTVFEPPLASTVLIEWNKACDEFTQTQFESARSRFEQLAAAEPRLEKASKLYLSEIKEWSEVPPPLGWGGELTFDSK
jgi:adenylate cyclase